MIASRWSGRAFDPNRTVDEAIILSLLEAARLSPSCYGDQPWRYILAIKNGAGWSEALTCLVSDNRVWAQHSALLIVATANSKFDRMDKKDNRWGAYDTGSASMGLSLQATAMGLMAHQMGGFDPAMASKLFQIPKQYIPVAMIAVGYQLPREEIPDSLKDRELAVRTRNPLGNNFFRGTWGSPFST